MRASCRRREGLGFELVGKLPELVEIDARPAAERTRDGLGRAAATRLVDLAQAGTDRAIDGLLERDALFAGALLQEARQVIVDGERRPPSSINDAARIDVEASRDLPADRHVATPRVEAHRRDTKRSVPASTPTLPGFFYPTEIGWVEKL